MLEDMECELLFSETRQAHTVGIIMVTVAHIEPSDTLPNISLDHSPALGQ